MCSAAGVSGGAMVLGSMMQSQAQENQLIADAQSLEFQADVERQREQDALKRGASDAGKARMAGTQAVSANKAALAANGVDVQSGTALDLLEDTRALSELDVQTIANNARRDAWGHKMQAIQYDYGAKAKRKSAEKTALAGLLSGVGGAAGAAGRA